MFFSLILLFSFISSSWYGTDSPTSSLPPHRYQSSNLKKYYQYYLFQPPPAEPSWSWIPVSVKTAVPSQVWSRYLCTSGREGQEDYLWPCGKLRLLKQPKQLDFAQVDKIPLSQFPKQIQDVTSFPVRPFVLPFLHTHIPLLREKVGK